MMMQSAVDFSDYELIISLDFFDFCQIICLDCFFFVFLQHSVTLWIS